MNDFLQNLRNAAKEKRYDRRRQYPSQNYRGVERRSNKDNRRRQYHQNQGQADSKLEEILPTLNTCLEAIAEGQKSLIELQERRAAAEERKATALERIAGAIARDGIPAQTNETLNDLKPTVSMDRDEVLDIIRNMRTEGVSFGKIAAHLEDLNITTFSGKGKWHAQTISKVCHKYDLNPS